MQSKQNNASRRSFLKASAATTVALGALTVPKRVHAGGSEIVRVGVIGCGGRGAGAAQDALSADPHTEIVAVGDTFLDRIQQGMETLRQSKHSDRIKVDDDHIFTGFDAYKRVIDSDVDIVIHAAPPHFRPEHLAYAVERGKHNFVEKPIAVDAPGVKSVQETCRLATQKKLAVVSGLCWRYDRGVQATMEQIQEGAIGDIVAIQSNYNTGTLWHRKPDPSWSRMEYQIRNWIYYTWLSGDHIVEQAIHSLDKTAWLQGDASPTKAMGIGGRQQRTDPKYGHVFDHHVVFYEYANGVPVYFTCRQQDNCSTFVDEIVLGTKGRAQILANKIEGETKWRYRGRNPSMFRHEHKALLESIRNSNPINNGDYMCNSTMIAIMGRMCTYSGKDLTWEQACQSEQRLGPEEYAWGPVPEPQVTIPGKTNSV